MTDLELADRNVVAAVETTAATAGIFISYARSDSSALAEELVAGLELARWIAMTLPPPKTGRRGLAR